MDPYTFIGITSVVINKMQNKRVQRTLHKVSGPLTRDVRRKKMKYLNAVWILALTLSCAWGGPVIGRSYHDIDASTEHYGDSKRDVMMRCQKAMNTFTNLLQHISSTNKQMRIFLQSIYDPMPVRMDLYSSGIFQTNGYKLIWPRHLYEKSSPSTIQQKFWIRVTVHTPPEKYNDEFYAGVGWDLLVYDLTNSVSITYSNGHEEKSLNRMLKDCILEAFSEFDRYTPLQDKTEGEQAGPGYPPQGVGSPDP